MPLKIDFNIILPKKRLYLKVISSISETSSSKPSIEVAKKLADELGVKVRDLVMPARLACTGVKVGPSLYDLMAVLGKEKVLARFDRALSQMG